MRLATVRTAQGTVAVRLEGDTLTELPFPDVGTLLAQPGWRDELGPAGRTSAATDVDFAPLIPAPGKILCVGLNYRAHILEMGRELPEHPTVFSKYPEALIGAGDPVVLPAETTALDWEAELAVVIGSTVRRPDDAEAAAAIAGFAVLNDVTMRDWQYRTGQWTVGKTWESTTPLGPFLVTPDELTGGTRPVLELSCAVDGEKVQAASTGDLVFDPVNLVRYLSTVLTLRPGDVIATGTPGGVGHARRPPRYLTAGSVLTTEIDGLGRSHNRVVADSAGPSPA